MSNPLVSTLTRTKTVREQDRADQVVNSDGGFVFQISDEQRLLRFLISGSYGTFYAGQQKVTEDQIAFLRTMLAKDEAKFVEIVRDVSVNGRALKQSPAIFATALALCEGTDKTAAKALFAGVVRTFTHLAEVCQYIETLGGWGRAKRGAVAAWYESKTEEQIAYQMVKYRSRKV